MTNDQSIIQSEQQSSIRVPLKAPHVNDPHNGRLHAWNVLYIRITFLNEIAMSLVPYWSKCGKFVVASSGDRAINSPKSFRTSTNDNMHSFVRSFV